MKAFDNSEFETARKQYEAEAKERWGKTDTYKEHAEKTKNYSKDKWQDVNAGMEDIFKEFAACMENGNAPDSKEAVKLAGKLQDYITENYYTCTKEILAGLGQMYVVDERFRGNIDKAAEGTAEFVSKTITAFCM